MFTQSDMHFSNFGVDENGKTVLMDFEDVGLLPETFVACTMDSDDTLTSIATSLGLSSDSNASMAAIGRSLWMTFDPTLGASTCT
jgi:predicted unusual protein kinase regulating ubiquinone biosynthesis (AarF/ABC1/UbiB family)